VVVKSVIGSVLMLLSLTTYAFSQPPDGYKGIVAAEKWTVLHTPGRRANGTVPIGPQDKLQALADLQFVGPKPSHPYVLGNFAADGTWGIVGGFIQRTDGKNAALRLAWADQFEIEGIMEHAGFGGWFFLLGWDQGHGYVVNNVTLKESGSPWFVGEMRGNKTIEDRTVELPKFDWKGEQPFRLAVENNRLSLTIGRFQAIDGHPLEDYSPGLIVLGVHDTNYGPKNLRIKSLRIRSLPAATGN